MIRHPPSCRITHIKPAFSSPGERAVVMYRHKVSVLKEIRRRTRKSWRGRPHRVRSLSRDPERRLRRLRRGLRG